MLGEESTSFATVASTDEARTQANALELKIQREMTEQEALLAARLAVQAAYISELEHQLTEARHDEAARRTDDERGDKRRKKGETEGLGGEQEEGAGTISPCTLGTTKDARVAPPPRVSTQAVEREFFWASVAMTGYAMIYIPPDGNCLFHAIADQLNREDDAMPWNHATLRDTAVRYMAENRNYFVETPLPKDRVGTWGGSHEIRALSLALKRQIAVLSAEQADGWQIFPEDIGLSDLEQTILADVNRVPLRVSLLKHEFSGNAHYNSVVTGPRAKGSGSKPSLPWAQDSSPKLPQLSGAVTRSGRGQAVKCSSPAKPTPQASSGAVGKRVPTGVPETTAAAADQQQTEKVGAPDAAIASGGVDGWECPTCTLRNEDTHLCCNACMAERPAAFSRAEKSTSAILSTSNTLFVSGAAAATPPDMASTKMQDDRTARAHKKQRRSA